MDKVSIRIRGPVPARLGRRFRRKVRYLATANPLVAASALYVAAANDRNLSGVWAGPAVNGTRTLRVHHTGTKVRRLSDEHGVVSFEGRFVSENAFEGYTSLAWATAAMRRRCDDTYYPSIRYRAVVDWEEGVILETFRSRGSGRPNSSARRKRRSTARTAC